MKQGKAKQDHVPGEKAPETGVYLVIHDGHRPEHEATLFRDEIFPQCVRCGEQVRFRLAGIALRIQDDGDFRT